MLHKLKKHSLINKLTSLISGENITTIEITEKSDMQITIAALLILIAKSDETLDEIELIEIKNILKTEFDLTDTSIDKIIKEAHEKTNNHTDLYGFVRIINKSLDQQARQNIVKMMWKIVFADKKLNNLEDNIMRKLCHLIGIDRLTYVDLKNEVKQDVFKNDVEEND